MSFNWRDVPAGSRSYLIPGGFISAAHNRGTALSLAGGVLAFTQVQIVVTDEAGERIIDEILPAVDLETAINGAPSRCQNALRERRDCLTGPRAALSLPNGGSIGFAKPVIMGVVNVTPDSFSDGGQFADPEDAIGQAHALAKAGADIIDIGGESTRPGAEPVWEGDERDRVMPVIEALAPAGYTLSIDSRRPAIQALALAAGVQIINDVSAMTADDANPAAAAQSGAPVILMHAKGDPRTMQDSPEYGDVLLEVFDFLEERIAACVAAGVPRSQIIVDPGIGFGKTVRHNLELIDGLGIFHGLGCPVLIGTSRKRFIGALSGEDDATKRIPGSLASVLHALNRGVQLVRVHDAAETRQAMSVWQGLIDVSFLAP